eukprot:TRINITY_DN45419_c0_g2_i1.p2 TRINITY_DN45419_c0_g2~~TRINITY_DN45419_c0_g2_i1.p2  ORF type:complete len:234 (-),score=55.12 TRINITY_DN45419_c0_g2_i1:375-1076(-)
MSRHKGRFVAEQQTAQECGLCALRNVLRPYREARLPTWAALMQDARHLEGGELEVRSDSGEESAGDEATSNGCVQLLPRLPCMPANKTAEMERADEDGNFGVEVLMCAASRQRIGGSQACLEYWAGRHLENSQGRELGFILGSGDHWWCIRRCGDKLKEWEEIDSNSEEDPRLQRWSSDIALYSYLQTLRDDTVLVLYSESELFRLSSSLMSDDESLEDEVDAPTHKTCCYFW